MVTWFVYSVFWMLVGGMLGNCKNAFKVPIVLPINGRNETRPISFNYRPITFTKNEAKGKRGLIV